MEISIQIDSILVQQKLDKILAKQGDWSQELFDSGILLLRSMDLNFAMQGRPTRWTPSQAAINRSGMTLQDTGRLRRSVSAFTSDTKFDLKNSSLSISSNVPYGKYLQEKWPFLMIQQEDVNNIINIFRNSIEAL